MSAEELREQLAQQVRALTKRERRALLAQIERALRQIPAAAAGEEREAADAGATS